MNPALLRDLSDPAAWGGRPVEVRQTHISVVFLVGDRAYKVKKPLRLGFLDFSTLKLRRRCCEEEVRLNRRLAPGVYLGVEPVVRRDGRHRLGGPGEVVDAAVVMRRLPDEATLAARLADGALRAAEIEEVGRRLAAFHADAERSEAITRGGGHGVLARNARENFSETEAQVGVTVAAGVHRRLAAATEDALVAAEARMRAREARGLPCDGHGDLRLEHVYRFPDRAPPDDLVVLDCVEFNARFRWSDPALDLAFLSMDLGFAGRRDLARALEQAWMTASDDLDAAPLLPLFRAYRSTVRAKVTGIAALEPELGEEERARAARRSAAHWLHALGELLAPEERPALLGVGGLPGTGKSTLAAGLAEQAGFAVVRADVVRKELAGLEPSASAAAGADQGLYAPAHTARTYAACLDRAAAVVREGGRAVVDATFRDEGQRVALLDRARSLGVRGGLLLCTAPPEVAMGRLDARRGDASDADRAIYRHAAERFEPPGPETARALREVPAGADRGSTLRAALEALKTLGLG